jgi:predicted nucleic acid-binding protein
VKVYVDTGVFIDYLSARGLAHSLRGESRGSRVSEQISRDAETLFDRISRDHEGATSCLTCYEAEEALFRELAVAAKGIPRGNALAIPAARSVAVQTVAVIDYFKLRMLDLSRAAIEDQLRNLDLQLKAVRSADALHLTTAAAFGADIFVTSDQHLVELDGVLQNNAGRPMKCVDTDEALTLLS